MITLLLLIPLWYLLRKLDDYRSDKFDRENPGYFEQFVNPHRPRYEWGEYEGRYR